jgi:parallel beta-helix repeat protein
MRKFYSFAKYSACILLFVLCFFSSAVAQTTIISPAGDGGFETGADFASNGWTVVNGAGVVNKWFVGTTASGFTNRAAYISDEPAGATWNYSVTAVSVVHFYRDVTLPAGQTDLTLSFDWSGMGEAGSWDELMVSIAPVSYTPVSNTTNIGAAGLPTPATTIARFSGASTTQQANVKIPAYLANNCGTANTVRLIFTWKNDDNTGTQPPIGIDNISLVARAAGRITSAGGTFTINSALPNSGTNFSTFTEAVSALNAAACDVFTNPVTFNVATNQIFTESVPTLYASGSTTGAITFQKAGTGANPKIIPLTAGSLNSSTTLGAHGDAIITISGGDYITFDGIDLETNSGFANEGLMEYGYYLQKASSTNACKNVTIKNCTINLNKASIYSFGIYVSNNANNTAVTVTSTGGRSENIKISGNTIMNCYGGIQLRGFAAASPYDLYDQNIEVGVDSGNVITDYGGAASAAYGIYSIYQNGLKVAKNTITSATGTTVAVYGIFTTTATNANTSIFNNTVTVHGGGSTASIYGINNGSGATGTNNLVSIYNNTVTGSTYTTATSGDFYGIYQSTTPFKSHIYGNTVNNNTLTPTTSGIFYGIYQSGSVVNESKMYNNTVSDNTKNTGTTGSFYCIYNSPAATAAGEIYGNVVSNNSSTGTTGTLYGINQTTGSTTNIYKNNITGLTINSAGGVVYGISITGGTTNNVYNNFISDLNAPSTSATADAIRGISVNYTTANSSINLSYNSIYLSANSGGTNFSTSGIYHSASTTATTASLTLRNNNVVNISNPAGTGKTSAYRRSSTTLTNFNAASNNNNYYAGSPSPSNVIFYDGTNVDEDLAAYKTRVSPRETNSVSEMPPFVNVSGAPYDLHLQTTTPTQLESGGIPVAGITDDYDGNPRNAGTPDIGADEFAGMLADQSAPVITFSPLLGDCSTGNKTVTNVTITDASGVPATGALVPRIYYRKGTAGTWYSKPGTLTSGTATNGTWSFTIVSADMGVLASGDMVSYYVIAQDVAGTTNISSNAPGVVATNVNTVTTHPANPASYYAGGAMTGTYTVGTAGIFKTLTQAVAAYNTTGCITGPVVFSLTDPDYSVNEVFPITIVDNPLATSTNTLTIKPAPGVPATINGVLANAAAGLFRLDGADHVTIDSLAINVIGSQTTEYGYAIQLVNDADSNTINRCTITATTTPATAGSSSFAGIVVNSSTATTPVATGNSQCDYNTISNNSITGGYAGITLTANGITNTIRGNKVINNTIQDFYIYGIYLSGNIEPVVEGNDISRTNRASVSTFYGVYLSTGNIGAKVLRNKIHNSFTGNMSSTSASYGVYTTGSDATASNPNIFANNWIYAFDNAGTQYGFYNSSSDSAKYYYNSILFDGPATTSATYDTRGFYQTTLATGLEYKNNIVVISRASIGENHALYMATATTTFVSDYNDFVVNTSTGSLNNLVYANTTEYPTLADWQASGVNRDEHSLSVDPVFVSPNDLHLQAGSTLDDKGTPIASVTNDIDGDTRDANTPDIGADEIPLSTGLDVKLSALVSPGATASCFNTENVVVTVKNNSLSTLNFATNPVTITVNVSGAATSTLTATISSGTLAPGATQDVTLNGTLNMSAVGSYTFSGSAALAGDINGSNNAMPVATRTKTALNAGTASSSETTYCLAGGKPTLSVAGVAGNSSIQWQQSTTPGTGFTNIAGANTNPYTVGSNITQTMYYRVVATCGTSTANSPEVQVNLSSPQVMSASAAGRCGAGPVTLTATGSAGTDLNWYTDATGGTPVYTGSTYTTPSLAANTTYYVSAAIGATNAYVGATSPAIGSGLVSTVTHYLMFTLSQSATIETVDVYPSVSGQAGVIEITNSAGTTVVSSVNYTTSVAGGSTPQTVILNVNLPAGSYRMRQGTPAVSLFRNDDGAVYPYTAGPVTITGNSFDPTYYYYFYNWKIAVGCESPRTSVMARIDDCPQPVTLLNFKGERLGSVNKLEWTTATEINNLGFELQRSADGVNFGKLSFIASAAQNGNSTRAITYNFNDVRPLIGSGYYRLKQIDKDGKVTFSKVVLLKGAKVTEMVIASLYPNPVSRTLNLVIAAPAIDEMRVVLTDLSGKIVQQKLLKTIIGDNKIAFDVQQLAAGTYLLKLVCNSGCETGVQKFVKQ